MPSRPLITARFSALALAGLAVCAAAQAAPQYTLTRLADMPGGIVSSQAMALNNLGVAAGQSVSADGYFGALWKPGQGPASIGDLAGGSVSSSVYGLNDAGMAVGTSSGPGGTRAVRWTAEKGLSVLKDAPGGTEAGGAYGVNNEGYVVGYGYKDTTLNPVALMWDPEGNLQNLGDLPGGATTAQAHGINDKRVVVGESGTTGGTHAFMWTQQDGMVDLGDLPGGLNWSVARAVNTQGWIAGSGVAGPQDGTWRATLWRNGQIIDLSAGQAGHHVGHAMAINDAGAVVGMESDANGSYAMLWQEGRGMLDLNTLVLGGTQGLYLTDAYAINEHGQIAGWGSANGVRVGYLLTPVPEPTSAALMAFGLAGLLWAGRRRREG